MTVTPWPPDTSPTSHPRTPCSSSALSTAPIRRATGSAPRRRTANTAPRIRSTRARSTGATCRTQVSKPSPSRTAALPVKQLVALRFAGDEELQRWVKENTAQTRDILLQLDPTRTREAVRRLYDRLGSTALADRFRFGVSGRDEQWCRERDGREELLLERSLLGRHFAALLRADLANPVLLADRLDHLAAFGQIVRQRLLAKDVQPLAVLARVGQ